jgi:hypothetical protein
LGEVFHPDSGVALDPSSARCPYYNYADLPLWDRLFGTYRDADTFAARCGFPRNNERQLGRMLLFRDVYKDSGVPPCPSLTHGCGYRTLD